MPWSIVMKQYLFTASKVVLAMYQPCQNWKKKKVTKIIIPDFIFLCYNKGHQNGKNSANLYFYEWNFYTATAVLLSLKIY